MPWSRFRFRGKQKVWIFVDDDGQPVVDGGTARMRYKVEDPREYSANPGNLAPIEGAEMHTDPVPPAEPVARSDSKSSSKRSTSDADRALGTGEAKTGTHGTKVVMKPAEIPTVAPEGVVLCFTDGACTGNPGPAGLGVAMLFGEHRKELWEYLGTATNNIAELTAILRALQGVKDRRRPVHIYSDSKYALGVLAGGWKAKANRELIDEIQAEMAPFEDLTLFKVLGHAGHPLNELADYLARRAIADEGGGENRSTEPLDLAALAGGLSLGADVPTADADTASGAVPKPSASAATSAVPATKKRGVQVVSKPAAIPESPPDGVVLAFTDGACFGNPGPAGWGAVIATGEEVDELAGYLGRSTNNVAELTAIQKVLEAVEDRDATVHIYTDSAYSIGVLGQGWKAKANKSLIADIKALLSEFSDVTLLKVKGHAGHALNERVDDLAKAAIDNR